ncbi:hypothetical protein QC762_0094520 [Podospora pseudocomata]|uniref:Uncharacterized protein n=2 Tax=Podospora TaxID=5144 RepID=A0ABR0G778_9PEZI|nr:hypothetical protein QC762_0094520 [Podospora pseudocomata]KAK4671244.1 hypothetical protein QC764_0093280 [Podospora pseudoanserina]
MVCQPVKAYLSNRTVKASSVASGAKTDLGSAIRDHDRKTLFVDLFMAIVDHPGNEVQRTYNF